MARSRNLKPGFFTNDLLAEIAPLGRLLFQGLWCHSDREGRLIDRPKKLKAEILPYDECDVNSLLNDLEKHGFIIRYVIDSIAYIQVVNFVKHQNPHIKEQASEIPAPDKHGASTVQAHKENGSCPADSLLPITSNPFPLTDPLNPPTDSIKTLAPPVVVAATKVVDLKAKEETDLQAACREVWQTYCTAYFDRYGTQPVRNARVNSQVKQFVQRIERSEAPDVSAFYVGHCDSFYVRKGHDFGTLLANAEKLRMEWATNRQITGSQARQTERVSSMWNAVAEIEAEQRAQA